MPTEPYEQLLNRNLSIVEIKNQISIASPLLTELVNFSTNTWIRCLGSSKSEKDVDLAVFCQYLNMIEYCDSIEELLNKGCVNPCFLLLRPMFECRLNINYLLDRDFYRSRSLAWLYLQVNSELKDLQYLTSDEFRLNNDNDEIVPSLLSTDQLSLTQTRIEKLSSWLNESHLSDIKNEFQRVKKIFNKPNIKWFQLFPNLGEEIGPKNLFELCQTLKMVQQYRLLYKYWSKYVHGDNAMDYINNVKKSDPLIRPVRNIANIRQVVLFSSSFLLYSTRAVIDFFRPGENYSTWYVKEIRDYFSKFIKNPLEF